MTEYERAGNRRKRSYTGAIAVMVTLMIVIIGSVALLFLPEGKNETRKPAPTSAITPTPIASIATEEDSLLAVVLAVDTEIKTLRLYDVKREEEVTVVYAGSSTFTDSFGKPMSAAQLPAGVLLKFTINAEDNRVVKAVEPRMLTGEDGIWEKKDVDKLEIVPGEHRITFGGQNYQYTDGLCVMSNGVPVELDTLLPIDRVSVRGSGSQIYEIIVTRGHGYLALSNHEDFVDGTITIGNSGEQTITEEAKYLVKEGTYKVTVTHGKYTGTETIAVARDETAVFDVFEYGSGPIKKGTVIFTIEPLGATLYIDGERTSYYGEELTLEYGVHSIEVAAGGYITYEASIHVNSERQQLSIYLTEQVPEEEEDPEDPTTDPEAEAGSQEGNGTGGGTTGTSGTTGGNTSGIHTTVSIANRGYEINENNAIYILGPTGATVYLDGELLGTAPIDFEKIIGSYLLTIVTEDGEVKNYNCTETDNGEDTYYNFD
ncbi:MAG: PEGA domain-containing protein [Lachnospiraceae bacterium]